VAAGRDATCGDLGQQGASRAGGRWNSAKCAQSVDPETAILKVVPITLICHLNGGISKDMEKRRPTYDLEAIKAALGSVETLAMTTSALRDAASLGFDRGGIVETINSIERTMFLKSMTTLTDHRVWQDVYHVPTRGLVLYVKVQVDVVTEFQVMSFKEK
jgi:motility quorum-sensing regulator/GCU-specific mRNA interferase toxin